MPDLNRFEFFATIERYHTIQNPTSEEKLDLAIRYCTIRDGMHIVDVGCGKGWLARRLARQFDIRVTCLEVNPAFAAEARRLAAAEGVAERTQIVEGPALQFRGEPESFDVVLCIGACFALGGFDSALQWMSRYAKRGGVVAIGEPFAKELPLPDELSGASAKYDARSLWMTVDKMRSHCLALRGIVESSADDWDRYESLHWQAALDWTLENPGHPDAGKLIAPDAAQRRYLEIERRYIGWAIFVARNGRC